MWNTDMPAAETRPRRAAREGISAMTLRLAYNTNGTTSHRLEDALMLMAETGYSGVALTLDHLHLNPFAADWSRQAERLRLTELGEALVEAWVVAEEVAW